MTTIHALAITAALGAATLAGCGTDPSCDKAVAKAASIRDLDESARKLAVERCNAERWSGALRRCIAGADDEDELGACARKAERRATAAADPYDSYMARSKRSEAELNLNAIERALKIEYAENAAFVDGSAPLTPATDCCEHPGKKCPPSVSDWAGVDVWDRLGFELTSPSYFRYSYQGTVREATAEAVGDLDCDGVPVTYTLRCEAESGTPRCTLVKPARAD